MLEEAKKYATNEASTFQNSLQYLIDQTNQNKVLDQQSATQRYTNLVNQINQQKYPIEQQYNANTRAAYVNKMLAGKKLEGTLSQMGLNTGGFGVGQQMLNETAYGQNYNQLGLDKSNAYQNINNQVINAGGEYQAGLSDIDSTYGNRLTDLQKYITESTQNKYDTEVNKYMSEKQYQDEIAFRNQQRQDELKQLSIENAYKNRALNAQYGGGGSKNPFDDDKTPEAATPALTNGQKLLNGVMNVLFGNKTTTNTKPVTQTTKPVANTVTAKSSPNTFSSGAAQKWFSSNMGNLKSPTIDQLKQKLSEGYNKGSITKEDMARILATYGLK